MTTTAIAPEVKTEREEFHVDFPFTKAVTTEKGDLELVGYASTWVKDRDGERIDPHAFDATIENYLSLNPIVLWQHNHDCPLGSITSAEVDENGLKVVAIIPKPEEGEAPWAHTAYNKIAAGIVKTFSIGGYFERELRPPADGGMFDYELMDIVIVQVDLYEVSCVSVPANPDSIFEAAKKAFGDSDPAALLDDRRRAALKQVEQLLGMKDVTDPELVGMSDEERAERFNVLIKGWGGAVGYDDYRVVEALVEQKRFEQAKPLATALNDALYLPAGTEQSVKAGRVLSKANQGKLEQAMELLGDVIGQVHDAPELDADTVAAAENELSFVEGEEKESVSDASWDGSASRFTDAQWRKSCVLDRGKEAGMAKARYGLPVREPSGTLNRNGVHAAAQRFSSVSASAEAKKKAAKRLVKLYRGPLKEDPPESLVQAAS